MVFITLGVVAVTALVTGLGTYFTFRQSPTSGNSGATAEIRNDVNIEENFDRGGDIIGIFGVIILTLIAIVKIIELTIYFVNRCKRSMKKRYEGRTTNIPLTAKSPTAPTITTIA